MTEFPSQAAILYVDDEPTALKYFERAIGPLAPVLTASSVEQGKQILDAQAGRIAVLVSDQRMPGASGNALLAYAWERYPHMVRILATAYSEIEQTVEAVNLGQIHRYIQKPWDIAKLRMELRQALDLARLRKEHNELLHGKLQLRQKETIANRIGAVYTLCASLAGPEQLLPVEAYLAAALAVGVAASEPDWLLVDYSDLISAEAFRCAAFGSAVRAHYGQIEREHPDKEVDKAIDMLAAAFGDSVKLLGGAVVFVDGRCLSEFLETPATQEVSSRHAFWLACLLWLGRRGWSLTLNRIEPGWQGKLAQAEPPLTPSQLSAWVQQF